MMSIPIQNRGFASSRSTEVKPIRTRMIASIFEGLLQELDRPCRSCEAVPHYGRQQLRPQKPSSGIPRTLYTRWNADAYRQPKLCIYRNWDGSSVMIKCGDITGLRG
jgi:hypothetical protein